MFNTKILILLFSLFLNLHLNQNFVFYCFFLFFQSYYLIFFPFYYLSYFALNHYLLYHHLYQQIYFYFFLLPLFLFLFLLLLQNWHLLQFFLIFIQLYKKMIKYISFQLVESHFKPSIINFCKNNLFQFIKIIYLLLVRNDQNNYFNIFLLLFCQVFLLAQSRMLYHLINYL